MIRLQIPTTRSLHLDREVYVRITSYHKTLFVPPICKLSPLHRVYQITILKSPLLNYSSPTKPLPFPKTNPSTAMSTHAAIVTVSPRSPLQVLHLPSPAPRGNEILIRNLWTASTPLDLHQADGGLLVTHPQVLGDGVAGCVSITFERCILRRRVSMGGLGASSLRKKTLFST